MKAAWVPGKKAEFKRKKVKSKKSNQIQLKDICLGASGSVQHRGFRGSGRESQRYTAFPSLT